MLKLSFHGGARSVTGANYLLESDANGRMTRILVDCGMFQCPKFCDIKNRNDFSYDPSAIDALFVTHGHIDHLGRVPKLVKEGFRGVIYSSPPTKDFGELMLEDSLGVLEKEAKWNSEKEPFYSTEDISTAMSLWKPKPYGSPITVGNMRITLRNAGHILGSAMVEVEAEGKKLLFTGDLGNTPMPLLPPPENVTGMDYIIIESAYGDREHEDKSERKLLVERAIEDIANRNGVLIMPSFALERTQELIFEFDKLVENGRVPRVPFFIDSPLAIRATAVYKKHHNYFGESAREIIKEGDDIFNFPGLNFTLSTEESKAILDVPAPKIILAGAGMMHGGRILHHARNYLPGNKNMILFIGYQAAGGLGRRIQDGAGTVKIFGDEIRVDAEVRSIGGYSAHADTNALFDFVKNNTDTAKKVFVVQGEAKAALFLVQKLRDRLGINASAPEHGDSVEL